MIDERNQGEASQPTHSYNRWLAAATVLLLVATAVSLLYWAQQSRRASQLAAAYDQMSVALSQTRSQVDALTAKLNSMVAQPSEPAEMASAPAAARPAPTRGSRSHRGEVRHTAAKRAPADDPRWKQVQAELAEHQKQIEATRQDVENARSDFEGKLTSTHDELSGSIAQTHEELVALQKRGERNYYEFDFFKSKQFHRAGPVSVSLRKANTKRQYCDLEIVLDDYQITKKHVNLYEPVLLYPADYTQPLELVINRIEKNQAAGYVSAPKYRQSELAKNTSTGTPASPLSTSAASLERHSGPTPQ